ncbi:VCBS domain-containing protein, partial [Methylobacterium sp. Leaf88]|uniref:VCBS domain-containing protein n=1 Tax=Methylobacterium sp. Leaf88 TaxID=1736244 RepID=UPI000A82E62C
AIVADTTGGGAGRLVWTWNAPDKALDFLAAGQTLDQTYTLTLSDGQGGLVRQDVTVTLVGSDDLPTITGSAGATWYEGAAVNHSRSGTLAFADADLSDHLTVSVAGQSLSYVTAAGVDLSASLTPDQIAALKAAFTMPTGDLGANKGSATWTYAIADTALDFIGQNDALKLVTTVVADDGHGGSAQQAVTITLKGVNDAPTIKGYAPGDAAIAGTVTEKAGVFGDAGLQQTGGAFAFADADLSDAHSVRITPKAGGYLGTLAASVVSDTTGGGTGSVGWTFQVADKALDGLAAGQSVTQTYTMQVGDGKSGAASQDVTVTLTGSADQFVFQGLTKKALPSFGAGDTLSFQHTALGGHTEAGVLPDDYFVTGTAATLAGHGQFLNDVAHKQLLWDADGTGAGAAVVVATFATPQTNLHAHDILLV